MGSNPIAQWVRDVSFNWFIVKSQLTYIVKYKFLHMFRQEICGSQVRALPHGFRGCWFESSQISVIWVNAVVRVRRCGGSWGPPLSSRTMSSRGLCFSLEKMKMAIKKKIVRRPFPTYLGSHRLLFKGLALQKENDANLHIYTPTRQKHYLWLSWCPSYGECPSKRPRARLLLTGCNGPNTFFLQGKTYIKIDIISFSASKKWDCETRLVNRCKWNTFKA